ncbi:hypothetical protein AURDEDRAFT_177130 [Auricularia subglabra TFB-10046 SS5]|uniref:Uncharacterized protein n=1 Tax=Auricularia subglabra (strain TFB-10046 / SS5) TaxID=717982 RepID=J0LBG4_AURST|nr:hypothetical protein AURDEDRAFT_177130 [Auricularia subglabra TFB-10046 SS5]
MAAKKRRGRKKAAQVDKPQEEDEDNLVGAYGGESSEDDSGGHDDTQATTGGAETTGLHGTGAEDTPAAEEDDQAHDSDVEYSQESGAEDSHDSDAMDSAGSPAAAATAASSPLTQAGDVSDDEDEPEPVDERTDGEETPKPSRQQGNAANEGEGGAAETPAQYSPKDLQQLGIRVREFDVSLSNSLISASVLRPTMTPDELAELPDLYNAALDTVNSGIIKKRTLAGLGPPPFARRAASSSAAGCAPAGSSVPRALSTGQPPQSTTAVAPLSAQLPAQVGASTSTSAKASAPDDRLPETHKSSPTEHVPKHSSAPVRADAEAPTPPPADPQPNAPPPADLQPPAPPPASHPVTAASGPAATPAVRDAGAAPPPLTKRPDASQVPLHSRPGPPQPAPPVKSTSRSTLASATAPITTPSTASTSASAAPKATQQPLREPADASSLTPQSASNSTLAQPSGAAGSKSTASIPPADGSDDIFKGLDVPIRMDQLWREVQEANGGPLSPIMSPPPAISPLPGSQSLPGSPIVSRRANSPVRPPATSPARPVAPRFAAATTNATVTSTAPEPTLAPFDVDNIQRAVDEYDSDADEQERAEAEEAASMLPADLPNVTAQQVTGAFTAVMHTLHREGKEPHAPLRGRPSAEQARAMDMISNLFTQITVYAAGSLGIGTERIRRLIGQLQKPRQTSRFALFKSFLRNCEDAYEDRRKLDDLFGRKPKYTIEEAKAHYVTFCGKFNGNEQDGILIKHELVYPYGPDKGTPTDRFNTFQAEVNFVMKLLEYLSAFLQIESTILLAGSRSEYDNSPALGAVYSTYFGRDYLTHKMCVTPATALERFRSHVQNNAHNNDADKTAIAAGQPPAGTRVSLLAAIPPGTPSASSLFIPARAVETSGAGSTSNAMTAGPSRGGSSVPRNRKKRATPAADPVDDGEESGPDDRRDEPATLARGSLVPGKVTIYTPIHGTRKMMSIVLNYDQLIPPTIDYTLQFTAEEKALAVTKLTALLSFANIKLHGNSMPMARIIEVLIKYRKMLANWPPWVYFYSEFTSRTAFDSLSVPMQGGIILFALLEIMYVADAIVLDKDTVEQVVKSTGPPSIGPPSFVICLSAPYPSGVGNPNWAGTCRAMLNNRTYIGLPASQLVPHARPVLAVPPVDHPTKTGRALLKLHSVVCAAGSPSRSLIDAPRDASPASRRSADGDVGDSDDETRLAPVQAAPAAAKATVPAKATAPAKKAPAKKGAPARKSAPGPTLVHPVLTAEEKAELHAKAQESHERRQLLKYVDVLSDIDTAEDGAVQDSPAAAETHEDEAAAVTDTGAAEPRTTRRKKAGTATRSSPRKQAKAGSAPTARSGDEASETEQFMHQNRKRKAATTDSGNNDAADAADDAPSKRVRIVGEGEGDGAGEGAGAGDAEGDDGAEQAAAPKASRAASTARAKPAAVAGAAKGKNPAAAAKTTVAAKGGQGVPKPDKPAAKPKAATKSKAAAKAPEPPLEPAPSAAGTNRKRKRSEKDDAAAVAPPRKSARTAASDPQPQPQPAPEPGKDDPIHPWSKEGLKTLSVDGVTLSASIVKRLTTNTTPLTAENGGTIKRCSFWPKGFEFPEGLDDEDHVNWVVLSRAFEGVSLSDLERKIVRHAYKVWPQDVVKSSEMQQMFLKVLVG